MTQVTNALPFVSSCFKLLFGKELKTLKFTSEWSRCLFVTRKKLGKNKSE